MEQSYRNPKKTSVEDWAAVHAIAQEYTKEIDNTVALRENLKASEFYRPKNWDSRDPEVRAKIGKTNFAVWQAAKTVRDLEREQWARMAEYLSPYELRKYKLDHSQFAHDLRMETEWFQPDEGEFLALFTYHERKQNLYDEMAGKGKKMEELFQSSRKKIDAVHEEMWHSVPKIFRDREAMIRTVNSLEGEDMDFYRARMGSKRGIDSMSKERWLEYDNRKFLPQDQVARGSELRMIEELVQNGQATQWDLEEAKRQVEKMQQAEEQHASGQLTDAELEAMRIKVAAGEEFSRLQASGRESLAEEVAQEAREKIERLLTEEAKEVEAQRAVSPQANEHEEETP